MPTIFYIILESKLASKIMSVENWRPIRQFIKLGDAHHCGEWGSNGEGTLHSQLLDRRMISIEAGRRTSAIVVPLSSQLEEQDPGIGRTQRTEFFLLGWRESDFWTVESVGSTFQYWASICSIQSSTCRWILSFFRKITKTEFPNLASSTISVQVKLKKSC